MNNAIAPILMLLATLTACTAADKSPATQATPATAPAAEPAIASTPPLQPATATDPVPAPTTAADEVIAGWYMEHGGMTMFQRCGNDTQLSVDSAELRARAKDFGLDEGNPVYVRVAGTVNGNTLTVASVEQFGSPTPVRDCGMTGVVMPSGG